LRVCINWTRFESFFLYCYANYNGLCIFSEQEYEYILLKLMKKKRCPNVYVSAPDSNTLYVYVLFITVFTVFRLLTDFVCLYDYEFWLSLCNIVRSSVILCLPLFMLFKKNYATYSISKTILKNFYHSNQTYKYNATDKVWENLLIELAFKHCICK
jgi:hypothetical protein